MVNNVTIVNRLDRAAVLADEDVKNVSFALEADVVKFAEEIVDFSLEDLKAAEAELMEQFKQNEEYLSQVEYELQNELDYDKQTVTRNELAKKVVGFLDTIEVPFQATLGLYQCIRFWETEGSSKTKKIPYGAYDSTLRMLGNLKFKGKEDCFNILVVNNWFATAHGAYLRDNIWTTYLSALHQAIMKSMEQLEKAPVAEPEAVPEAGATEIAMEAPQS